MFTTLLFATLIIVVGSAGVAGCTYLVLGKGLTFYIMVRLLPATACLCLDICVWMLVGGPTSIKADMVVLPVGISILTAGFILVGQGLGKTISNAVDELQRGAEQIVSAANQVAQSSQTLAGDSSKQASSLEETSASAAEINARARQNTDSCRSTVALLAQSEEKVASANRQLGQMVTSMNQITESSGKISKIIKVIDDIAFQTNILALNAAVEAARAGEAGMGFAVVADEVRGLAQRSAQAAKDTASLIEESIANSSGGKSRVDEVALAISALTEETLRVKTMVDEISSGSEEQSRGIDQISRAVAEMERVTQTNAAMAQQSAAAAEELNAQSAMTQGIVSGLHAMVRGQAQRYA
ncbi:methyl-accepting chemotaxis protein [Granulicella sibirica]|uniref:Methyl-accepting chemotaxis protein I (Serine chemoreceptor protein) n=1 Tax=Granulicella sibirica TaxID=2479048 RepID=A0A4Q0SYG9_9BACT|nr:methyl-accepting chemotaxis protein [Granulicella sibirica]RXH55030.1 Methyl-accepting chemotaxis protein I (serine chemoreceptor protein) [Granulicella sibirica]